MSFTHYNDCSCFEVILDKFGCIALRSGKNVFMKYIEP